MASTSVQASASPSHSTHHSISSVTPGRRERILVLTEDPRHMMEIRSQLSADMA